LLCIRYVVNYFDGYTAEHPNVVSLFENKGHELQTTRSWEFLGLENNNGVVPKDSIWEKARYGDGTIIANIDTGRSMFRITVSIPESR
jgi:hypothetical protein